MKTEEIKVKLSKLTRRKNEEVERQFVEFSERTKGFKGISIQDIDGYGYSGVGNDKSQGFCSGRSCYAWNEKEQWWYRETEIKPPPPKYSTFLVFGGFEYGTKEKRNFFLVRIPYKGLNWHKKVVPELRKLVNKLAGESKTYWNTDTYEEIDKTWDKPQSQFPVKKFYWRGEGLVEKRKA